MPFATRNDLQLPIDFRFAPGVALFGTMVFTAPAMTFNKGVVFEHQLLRNYTELVVAEVHALMQGFQPLHHLYSWHKVRGVLISQGVGHPSPRLS